ncbi:MAG: helix-turn-helix transcriptional regulator [Corynebacterium sp.]|jgi:DNA-binding Xre family transcriptional regulator|nr:helix-turn-helix transcriptional regulator [Corynebacterium sp.]
MPSSFVRDLGDNIRAEMARRRVTLAELSRRTGIARSTLHHQINVGTVSAPTLVEIARVLDVDVNDLIDHPRVSA